MKKTEMMDELFKVCHMADLIKRSGEELMDLLNEDNPTKHDYVEMVIRARFLLNTAQSVAEMIAARGILNQIYDDFYGAFPEDYAWYMHKLCDDEEGE